MADRWPWRAIAVVVVCLAGAWLVRATDGPVRRPAVVVTVIDGDTIVVSLGETQETVRLIGIDTPEAHRSEKLERQLARGWDEAIVLGLGRQAKTYLGRMLGRRRVGIELDVEQRDRYGRLLAYVWLADDTLVNAELLRHGYARRLTIPPNLRYVDRFGELEAEARESGRGLWASWPPVTSRETP